jgi:protein N-terminal amidase
MNSRKPLPTVTLNLTKSSTICRLSISLRSAKRLHAFVMVGYPQIVQGEDNSSPIYYNSACLVDRHGKLITTYQKRFLYQVDEAWAQEGPAFQSIYVEGLGKVK